MEKDQGLIERARNGDLNAFKDLVTEHKKNVYFLAYDLTGCKEDAEDITQDVFLKVFKTLNSFRGDAKFSTWLYRITVNTSFSHKRKKDYTVMKYSREIENPDNSEPEISSAEAVSPERETENSFKMKHIEKAMQKLTEYERSIFTMRNISGMSFEEIVEIMNIQPGTARSTNFKALRKLRKELAFYKNDF